MRRTEAARRPRRWIPLAVLLIGGHALFAMVATPESHAAPRATPRPTPPALSYAAGEVVVIAAPSVLEAAPGGALVVLDGRLRDALAAHGLHGARRVDAAGVRAVPGRDGAWVLASDRPGFDPVAASRAIQATGAVRAASPNYRFGLFATLPDDLYLIYQWYVDDSGFADIGLPFAWDVTQGDSSVVIAILDTGVDTGHPDLAAKIWRNAAEIEGNALDDDGNGFVDDVRGWDFGTSDNDPNPEYTMDASGLDVGFHGTFCAGIAAAATNNFEGIAGASWRSRIMPLKVSHPDSGITSDAIAGAFLYAVDEGASVISMSFGGPGDPGVPEFFQALVDLATFSGTLCVAAAGNDGSSVPTYPAACDRVLAVGAADFNDARASFSNWGPWVDIAAPGSLMWSTICRNYTFSELDQLFYVFLFNWDGVNPYMYGDGTSFACPLVAGVAALVRARYPDLTPALVAQHLVGTGDAVAYDLPIGPKVNAFAAVSSGPVVVAVEESQPAPARAHITAAPNPVERATEIGFALPSGGAVRLILFDAAGRRVRTLLEGARPAGRHAIAWDGRRDDGRPLPAGVYFARLESPGALLTTKVILIGR
jgi:subtilisin family serine protease